MTRSVSHGRAEFRDVPDSAGLEKGVDVELSLAVPSDREDEFVRALNEVIERFAI